MLQTFRNLGEAKITKWLLGLLVISFGLWGIQDYVSGNLGGGAALTVNNRQVPLSEIDATYRNRVKVVTQMLGTTPTPEQLEQLNVPQMVLTEVVHRHVLNDTSARLELEPAASVLRREIMNTEAFKENGAFSPNRYKQMLTNQGLTTRAYEKMLGEQMGLAMLSDLIALPRPDPKAITPLLQQATTTYKLEALKMTPNDAPLPGSPSDATLQNYYAANQHAYAVPEKRSFKVLMLNPVIMAGTIQVTDQQVADAYNAAKDTYKKPEKRHVRHILVGDSAKAVELYKQIKTHDDFIRLADSDTIDPSGKGKGGDLGVIAESDVVPAFAKAAFALPVGKVSEPVKSSFGWHLIWVEEIQPPAALTLDEVKDTIRKQLVQDQTADALQNLMRTIDDRAAAGNSVADIATATGLKPDMFSLLTASSTAADSALVAAAFAADPGRVEGPVEMGDGSLAYVEVTTVVPASVPTMESIKARVTDDYVQAERQTMLTRLGNALAAEAQKTPGQSLAQLTKGKAEVKMLDVTGPSDAPEWLHARLLEVYGLPVNGVLPGVLVDGSDRWLVRLAGRSSPAMDDAKATTEAQAYRERLQQDVEALLLGELVRNAKISYNVLQLRQIFGATWNPPQ